MGVAVLGENAQAWLVAAHASASSGRAVALVHPNAPRERLTLSVQYADRMTTATIDLAPHLLDTDRLVIVAAPELGQQRSALEASADDLAERTIVLAPGGAGGVTRAAAILGIDPPSSLDLAEVTGFPVLGSFAGRTVTISLIKRRLPIGALDAQRTAAIADIVRPYLPDVEPVQGSIATSLANTNNVVHPPLAVVNAARIERGLPFRFYREGLTLGGARLIDAVDRDRLAVTDALGLERVSITDWFRRFYSDQGLVGDDIATMLGTFEPLAGSIGPTTTGHRYLTDDVESGLAVIEAVGRRLALPMVAIGSVCDVVSTIVGRDLRVGAADIATALLERGGTARISPHLQVGALASAGIREGS